MGEFNILDEAWINVMTDDKGSTKEVSVTDLFAHAQEFKGLAGDMVVQDFAVMRFLLSVLHTVFSRFDASGKPYRFVDLDEKFKQLNDVDERHQEEYKDQLLDTWYDLWDMKTFPPVVQEYLSKWYDHFYLFDENYPFYQVTKQEIFSEKISKSTPSSVAGKNMNRLISESANKTALFSPRFSADNNKERLRSAEVVRWLLTFQGYSGLSDKVIFGKEKYKSSKGWLFDIGGVIAKGSNLYETLLLNCIAVHSENKFRQRPCWEFHSSEVIDRLFSSISIDNFAELYTNWSRAIFIDPEMDMNQKVEIQIVKVPEVEHTDNFLEPMTLWRFNNTGENKNKYTPRKHRVNQSIWRSFGMITLPTAMIEKEEHRKPGIIEWLSTIRETVGDSSLTIQAISMQDDGNATSWVPIEEIIDSFNINNYILTDVIESGWVPRINEAVELTKMVVERTYRNFISDIREIRNLSSKDFVENKVEELYFSIDQPFRNWLTDLTPDDGKDEKIFYWMKVLKRIVLDEANVVLSQAGPRDFTGITKDNKTKNIATAYNSFLYFLNKQI